MLLIRGAQLAVFATADRARFTENLLSLVLEEQRDSEQEEIRMLVNELIDRALDYGIDDEADVKNFVRWSFELGPRFECEEEYTWARTLLDETELSGAEKVGLLRMKLEGGTP